MTSAACFWSPVSSSVCAFLRSIENEGVVRKPSALPAATPTRGRSEVYWKHMNLGCQLGWYFAFERYRDSSCQFRLASTSPCRQSRATGPAPTSAPRSKASRNMAKLSETRPIPNAGPRSASAATISSTSPLSEAGSRRIRSRLRAVATPRDEAQEASQTHRRRPAPRPGRSRRRAGPRCRPSAMEKPRSSPPSPRHLPAASASRAKSSAVRERAGARWSGSRVVGVGRPTGGPTSCRGRSRRTCAGRGSPRRRSRAR